MLEGLDDINWSQLHHAYGEASDVPGYLHALLSPNAEERERALWDLVSAINHQGTVYEASFYAVPFLFELLKAPTTPDKFEIAILLADLGNNSGGPFNHELGSKVEDLYRKTLAKQGRVLEEEVEKGRWFAESIRQTIKKEIDLLYPYLFHELYYVRAVIAHALRAYPELSQEIIPLLEKALESEKDKNTRETIEDTIKILNKKKQQE